jgi:hypothetical protein
MSPFHASHGEPNVLRLGVLGGAVPNIGQDMILINDSSQIVTDNFAPDGGRTYEKAFYFNGPPTPGTSPLFAEIFPKLKGMTKKNTGLDNNGNALIFGGDGHTYWGPVDGDSSDLTPAILKKLSPTIPNFFPGGVNSEGTYIYANYSASGGYSFAYELIGKKDLTMLADPTIQIYAMDKDGNVVGSGGMIPPAPTRAVYGDGNYPQYLASDLNALGAGGIGRVINSTTKVIAGHLAFGGTTESYRAVLWQQPGGRPIDLNPTDQKAPSLVYAMNDNGWIVGSVNPGGGSDKEAFIYRDGSFRLLRDLVNLTDPKTKDVWELVVATDVNFNGEIVGYGTFGGDPAAFYVKLP